MKTFSNITEIIEFAIGEEQAAIDFYLQLAGKSKNSQIKKVFQEYAEEEMRHKAKLMGVKEQGIATLQAEKVRDLKIADYLVDVRASADMPYQDSLVLAMKKEKAAFRLYTILADRAEDPEIKNLFYMLAQEESKHKLRFELEYDDFILKEN